ncbi:hypothetical protein BHM03_00029082 [Ensete ventricosum]|uniref:Uncharacterized protein n=1 Tax=Ensete ventricosum TaxID=4639 RepID=A0A445MI35_ENSVE|nr:hypothetical protein BHM03_00029082 [Ensete ventricosum]
MSAATMTPTVARSSLEVMLDTIRLRDEQPKDVPPALPVRPTSRGRLPTSRRSLAVNLKLDRSAPEQLLTDSMKWDDKTEYDMPRGDKGAVFRSGILQGKRMANVERPLESPYIKISKRDSYEEKVEITDNPGTAAVQLPSAMLLDDKLEWHDTIKYALRKVLGKLIEIHFSAAGKICGAKIQTCKKFYLEKQVKGRIMYSINFVLELLVVLKEYAQDGIDWAKVEFLDNTDCLNLLEKECNTNRYHPYQAVCTGPLADRYVDRSLSGDTTDWGCFRLVNIRNRPLPVDFDCRRSLLGRNGRFRAVSIGGGRKKKREKKNLEFGTTLRSCDPSPVGDFFSLRGKRNIFSCGEKEQGDVVLFF